VNQKLRIPDWILLAVFCGFFFYWRLSSFGLIGADEPRYAQVAREMLQASDWISPRLGGSPWLEKPPLYYWQAMVFYRLLGVSDRTARLPAVFDASLLVFAFYWFLRRFRPAFAPAGALVLSSSAGMVGYARAASMDISLAAAFALAILSWYTWFETGKRGFLVGCYLFLALGMLAKGPVAPLLAVAIIVIFACAERDLAIARKSLSIAGILTFCAVSLPWYVLVEIRNPQFFRVFILEHNLARFGTNLFHHPEPFWYYLPVTFLAWVPFSLFAVVALVRALGRFQDLRADPLGRLLVIWLAVVVFFFSISKSKLPGYILPALPAGVLLLANYVEDKAGKRMHWVLIALDAIMTAALIYGTLALPYILLEHRLPRAGAGLEPLVGALFFGVLIAALLLKTGWEGVRLAAILPAILTLVVALRLGAPALNETLSARPVSDALSRLAGRPLPVAVLLVPREAEFGLEFYRDQTIPRYELGQVPAAEHLVVARQGAKSVLLSDVPGRRVVYLGDFPRQRMEFFYVSRSTR
jgi:4-amino-4-deoxy-L-arabinose transferase-like glycosyltransferase